MILGLDVANMQRCYFGSCRRIVVLEGKAVKLGDRDTNPVRIHDAQPFSIEVAAKCATRTWPDKPGRFLQSGGWEPAEGWAEVPGTNAEWEHALAVARSLTDACPTLGGWEPKGVRHHSCSGLGGTLGVGDGRGKRPVRGVMEMHGLRSMPRVAHAEGPGRAGTPSPVQGEHSEVANAWAFPTPVADSERATQPGILRGR